MNLLLFFSPYILAPLLLSIIWKKCKWPSSWLNVLITVGVIALYPLLRIKLDEYYHPPEPGVARCDTGQALILSLNFCIFLPLSLGLQLLFNYFYLYKRKNRRPLESSEPQETD